MVLVEKKKGVREKVSDDSAFVKERGWWIRDDVKIKHAYIPDKDGKVATHLTKDYLKKEPEMFWAGHQRKVLAIMFFCFFCMTLIVLGVTNSLQHGWNFVLWLVGSWWGMIF